LRPRIHEQRAGDLAFRKDDMSEAIQTIKPPTTASRRFWISSPRPKRPPNQPFRPPMTTREATCGLQYNDLLDQIDYLAADSGYKGVNFLAEGELTVKFDEEGDSQVTITGINAYAYDELDGAPTDGTGLDITDATDWSVETGDIDADIALLDAATAELRTTAKSLSSNMSVVTIRQDFTEKMINTLEDGAVNLTIADMNEEGANMLMLQTRQALGTTSLSLASQAAQSVLRLF
jgi:flagellin